MFTKVKSTSDYESISQGKQESKQKALSLSLFYVPKYSLKQPIKAVQALRRRFSCDL